MTMPTALESLLNQVNTGERTFLISRDVAMMKKSTIAIIGLVIGIIAIVAIGLTAYFLCSNRSITELRPSVGSNFISIVILLNKSIRPILGFWSWKPCTFYLTLWKHFHLNLLDHATSPLDHSFNWIKLSFMSFSHFLFSKWWVEWIFEFTVNANNLSLIRILLISSIFSLTVPPPLHSNL